MDVTMSVWRGSHSERAEGLRAEHDSEVLCRGATEGSATVGEITRALFGKSYGVAVVRWFANSQAQVPGALSAGRPRMIETPEALDGATHSSANHVQPKLCGIYLPELIIKQIPLQNGDHLFCLDPKRSLWNTLKRANPRTRLDLPTEERALAAVPNPLTDHESVVGVSTAPHDLPASVPEMPWPARPQPLSARKIPWATAVTPVFAGVAMFLLTSRWWSLMFAALGPMVVLTSTVEAWVRDRKHVRRETAALADGCALLDALICENQRRIRRQYLDAFSPVDRLLSGQTTSQRGSRESKRIEGGRASSSQDALDVRLGQYSLVLSASNAPDAQDYLRGLKSRERRAYLPWVSEIDRLSAQSQGVREVAWSLRLERGQTLSLRGDDAWCVARAILLWIAQHYSPAQVVMHVVGAGNEQSWLRWLPHVVESPGLKERLPGNNATSVLQPESADENPVVLTVMPRRGLIEVCWGVPKPGSTAEIVLQSDGRGSLGSNGTSVSGRVDGLSRVEAESYARIISRSCVTALSAPLNIHGLVPNSVHAADVGLATTADEVRAHWATSLPGLSAYLGLEGGQPLQVDLVTEGPHALVAGTTGAGKSVLLQAWVVSLAARYSPDQVNFLLVDFKGGSAFGDCSQLPHCVGMVTDLEGSLAERMISALETEVRRREAQLAAHLCADIDNWQAARLQYELPPMPRLVVVIDEFAALAHDAPQVLDTLVDIAARGRSLGVHLILGTQRPAGIVSEKIRANVPLRICLRTADLQDSRDVIGSDHAAAIPQNQPGRALLRLGATGEVRSFRSLCLSLPIARSAPPLLARREQDVEWIPVRVKPAPDTAARDAMAVIVDAIRHAFTQDGYSTPERPWLAPLPNLVVTEDCPAGAMALVDLPREQAQRWWGYQPDRDGNLLIAGGPKSGVTNTMRVLLESGYFQPQNVFLVGGAAGAPTPDIGACVDETDLDHVRALVGFLGEPSQDARPRLLAIEGLSALIDRLQQLPAAAELGDSLLRIVSKGRESGTYVVAATDRPHTLPARFAGAFATHILMGFPDKNTFRHFDIDPRVIEYPRPGRAILLPGNHEIQWRLVAETPLRSRRDNLVLPRLPSRAYMPLASELSGKTIGAGVRDDGRTLSLDSTRPLVVMGSPGAGTSSTIATLMLRYLAVGVEVNLLALQAWRADEVASLCGGRSIKTQVGESAVADYLARFTAEPGLGEDDRQRATVVLGLGDIGSTSIDRPLAQALRHVGGSWVIEAQSRDLGYCQSGIELRSMRHALCLNLDHQDALAAWGRPLKPLFNAVPGRAIYLKGARQEVGQIYVPP